MTRNQIQLLLIASLCAGACSGKAELGPSAQGDGHAGGGFVDRGDGGKGNLNPPAEASTCPPDPQAAIAEPTCRAAREPILDKFDARAQGVFERAMGAPVQVLIRIQGGAQVCQLEPCAEKACPASQEIYDYWARQNLISQRCVRDFIATLGGESAAETFWLVNVFGATLTWPQIQTVASHPDVSDISPVVD